MKLKEIYRPVEKELNCVEGVLKDSLKNTSYKTISEINNYLLDGAGKKLRPVLVLLSAKASQQKETSDNLIKIASAVELVHMASLIHDDVIDKACLRHNRATINSKWNQEVSIALGDYLYSVAFELIADCGNPDIIRCVSSATKAMCEGEFLQVCERDNLDLLKERYMVIVKKKTAALFAASCQAGTLICNSQKHLQSALKEYGFNFGIAFQIVDDYLDLVAEEETIGKTSGQDIKAGEITLPILNLWESVSQKERQELEELLSAGENNAALQRIRKRLFDSGAIIKTKQVVYSFMDSAKEKIGILSDSPYKESLLNLADFVVERGFNN